MQKERFLHLPVGALLVKMRLERPAGRDKRPIKKVNSLNYGQSVSGGHFKP